MPGSRHSTEGISVPLAIVQLLVMSLVFYLWHSPLIQPAKIMVVLFHEMSHGLMALLTGGRVLKIEITPDEGGFCETEGGIAILIVSAGYLGSMFFGGMVLYLSRLRSCVPAVYGILTLVLAAAILTVLRDGYSRNFACVLAVSFILLGFLSPGLLGSLFLRVIGTVSCLYSILDIYWDILSQGASGGIQNDAVAFSELTGASPHAVGLAWLVVSVLFFLAVLRTNLSELGPPPARKEPAASTSAARA